MWPPVNLMTEDGFDLQWGTNVVGTLQRRAYMHIQIHMRYIQVTGC